MKHAHENDSSVRACCGNCVFLCQDTLGTVEWEHNKQIVIGNYCVLKDFEIVEGELIVISEGERNVKHLCNYHESNARAG